ncbi:MAG: FtsX-like permease family protein [Bacteroidales bacterium]|nr:FtsX-like permease family protein [Bacteroidales bacterium]
MLLHYIKIALRNLRKYPAQTAISVLGLAAGFVCLSLSALWMHYENTYDTMHKDYERIYAFIEPSFVGYTGDAWYDNHLLARVGLYEKLRDEYPEVEAVTCCKKIMGPKIINGIEAKALQVDSTFIRVFSLPLVDGDYDFLTDEKEVAITEEFAQCLFPEDTEVIGNKVSFSHGFIAEVGAVIKDYGEHSIFQFDIVHTGSNDSHKGDLANIYAKIYEKANVDSLIARVDRYSLNGLEPIHTLTIPLKTAHKLGGKVVNLSYEHLRVFLACSVLMVACALINYLVLYLIRLRGREREMALRIVNGSTVGGLMVMFIIEVGIVLLVAMAFGLLGTEWLHRPFARFANIQMDYGYIMSRALWIMLAIVAACLVICIAPIAIVRNRTLTGRNRRGDTFRKASSLVQLIVSLTFIFCTVVMLRQIVFLKNVDWGFNIKGRAQLHVSALKDPNNPFVYADPNNAGAATLEKRYEIAKRVREMPMVTSTIERTKDLGAENHFVQGSQMGLSPDDYNVDYLFYLGIWDIGDPAHGFTILEGTLPREAEWQPNEMVITESVRKALGLEEAVGHTVYSRNSLPANIENARSEFTIVAVIKDLHMSVTDEPYSFIFLPRIAANNGYYDSDYITITYMPSERKEFESRVHALMERDFPNVVYKLTFSEDTFNKQLKSETNLMTILGIITAVCILVAVFGVYSIVTLACAQRRKEIALRKIHGATLADILSIFIKEYGLIVLAASAVAFPIGYMIMKEWVAQYVKQAPIAWWIYAVILLAIVLLIALSVGSRVWRTARENPAEVIKRGN